MDKIWSLEEIAGGYREMAELNLMIAVDFAAAEEEAEQISFKQYK